MPVTPALGRWRQKNSDVQGHPQLLGEFEARLRHTQKEKSVLVVIEVLAKHCRFYLEYIIFYDVFSIRFRICNSVQQNLLSFKMHLK